MLHDDVVTGAFLSGEYIGISMRASEGCSGSRLISTLSHVL